MKRKLNIETQFGSHFDFESYRLDLVPRKKFLPIPSFYKFTDDDIPGDFDILTFDLENLDNNNIIFSRHFRYNALIAFDLNRQSTDRKTIFLDGVSQDPSVERHYYSNKTLYNNLQRLCFEVLEPAVEFAGAIPKIEHGLLFKTNIEGVDPDSFFSDQLKGNAVVFNFPDRRDSLAYRVFEYLFEFALFDKIILDTKHYDVPTIKISVNEKNRRLAFAVRK